MIINSFLRVIAVKVALLFPASARDLLRDRTRMLKYRKMYNEMSSSDKIQADLMINSLCDKLGVKSPW